MHVFIYSYHNNNNIIGGYKSNYGDVINNSSFVIMANKIISNAKYKMINEILCTL